MFALAGVVACDQAPTAPEKAAPPVVGSGGIPFPFPPLPTTGWVISGTVRNYTAGGIEPGRDNPLFGWLQQATFGQTTGRVAIDADGHYQFTVPTNTLWVSLFAGSGGIQQPCAVTVLPAGNVSVDVETVTDPLQFGANIPVAMQSRSPTISGVVYEQTSAGRRPVPNAWVSLDGLGGLGLLVADTRTDADGRYILCGVPQLAGLTLMASAQGFKLFEVYNGVFGVTTFDIELQRSSAFGLVRP